MKFCAKFIKGQLTDMSWVDDDHVFGTREDGSTHLMQDIPLDPNSVYRIAASKWRMNHEPETSG